MPRSAQPLGTGVKTVFWVVGGLTFVVGVTMFLFPQASGLGSGVQDAALTHDQLWPYPLRTDYITRFLGALFTGVGVGAFWAARQTVWDDVRGLFPPGITFTALATLASFMSLDDFDFARVASWAFFILYLAVLVAGIVTFVTYERQRQNKQ